MYQRMRRLFSWPGMKQAIRDYVALCTVRKEAKPEHVPYPGLLQPLPVPEQAWQVVSLDFVEGLPQSIRFNCILVVVDKFTRYAHFIPLSHPFTAYQVAQAYNANVYKLQGLPAAFISDRDRIFTSAFWQDLFRLAGTQLRMSSAYHPQTERVNQCLEAYIRCFVHTCPKKWSHWLALAELWYNSLHHSTLGMSPFEALYGHTPRHFGIVDFDCDVPELDTWMQEQAVVADSLHYHIHRACQRMKAQADKHRFERQFAVNDWVFMKLQPYIQRSDVTRANQKLAFKYYSPYQILQRIGEVSYKLALPPTSSIHPVLHVS